MSQTQPTVTPKLEEPKFGFNEYAERLNGRAAMIGFLLMVVIEYATNQGVLSWLGLKECGVGGGKSCSPLPPALQPLTSCPTETNVKVVS